MYHPFGEQYCPTASGWLSKNEIGLYYNSLPISITSVSENKPFVFVLFGYLNPASLKSSVGNSSSIDIYEAVKQ